MKTQTQTTDSAGETRPAYATAIKSDSTRIIPAKKANKAAQVIRNHDGSMDVQFGNGNHGTLSPNDADLQAFVIWTMLNSECTA